MDNVGILPLESNNHVWSCICASPSLGQIFSRTTLINQFMLSWAVPFSLFFTQGKDSNRMQNKFCISWRRIRRVKIQDRSTKNNLTFQLLSVVLEWRAAVLSSFFIFNVISLKLLVFDKQMTISGILPEISVHKQCFKQQTNREVSTPIARKWAVSVRIFQVRQTVFS